MQGFTEVKTHIFAFYMPSNLSTNHYYHSLLLVRMFICHLHWNCDVILNVWVRYNMFVITSSFQTFEQPFQITKHITNSLFILNMILIGIYFVTVSFFTCYLWKNPRLVDCYQRVVDECAWTVFKNYDIIVYEYLREQ